MANEKTSFTKIIDMIHNKQIVEISDQRCQMYRVGDCDAMIIVSRDMAGRVLSANCRTNNDFSVFDSDMAAKISKACATKSVKINKRPGNIGRIK